MFSSKSVFLFACLSLFMVMLVTVSCAPVVPEQPPAIGEHATPTPEIFQALNPSPTASDSTLPLTCQVTDLSVYVSEDWGYCFAYPGNLTIDEQQAADGILTWYGPALDDNADPIRVSLEVTVQPLPDGSTLTGLVDAYLTSFDNGMLPVPITREAWLLGSEPAEKLEPVPGLLSSRVIMAVHHNTLFSLRFHPSDIEIARNDLDTLTQTVTGSFAFLPDAARPASSRKTVSWFEFGQNVSLTYDSVLAPWVAAQTVPAVPVSGQLLFSEAHPAFVQFRFLGFLGGQPYDLPVMPIEHRIAQVMVFPTADFAGFGNDQPQGFANQAQALRDLLARGVEPSRCAEPIVGEPALPFLPWVNSAQTICAQPQMIEFEGGKGVRYLTYYSQGVNPVLEYQVFYTFQGLTDDGQFYVAAFFPVRTGIFPMEPPPCPQCSEPDYDPLAAWAAEVTGQLNQLNAQPADGFAPSLTVLDELIASIDIKQ